MEVLTGKALSVCLEFINETDEKVTSYKKCKFSLSLALLYLAEFFRNIKSLLFLQNGFKYKENSQLLSTKVPQKN